MRFNPLVPELSVRDLEKSLAFYLALGFEIEYRREDPPFAYLSREGAQLMLEEMHQGGWATAPLEHPFGRGLNLQMACADVLALAETLEQMNHALFRPIQEVRYETANGVLTDLEFLVQDPDGYLLRFQQAFGAES